MKKKPFEVACSSICKPSSKKKVFEDAAYFTLCKAKYKSSYLAPSLNNSNSKI